MNCRRFRMFPLLAALAMVLAACGGSAGPGPQETEAGGTADESPSAPQEPAELAQGVTEDEIHLGTVMPLTGAAAVAAEGLRAGVQAAIGEANEAGGVAGRTVKLTVLDDNLDPATHVANFRRLTTQESVFAVLVPAGSPNLPATWPIAEEAGIPVFGPYLPDDPGIKPVFSLGTSHYDQVRVLVDVLGDKGASTFSVIALDNDLGQAISDGVADAVEEHGFELVSDDRVEPNSTNVSAAVVNARDAQPDAVILGTDGTQSSLILKQAAELGWEPMFAGTSSTASTYSTVVTEPAGDGASGLYGAFFAASPSDDSAAVTSWKKALEAHAENGDEYTTSSFALHGYAFAQVFLEILERMGDDLTWENFYAQAESLSDFETDLLPPVTFGPLPDGHVGTRGAGVAQFADGEWVAVTEGWREP